MFFLNFVDSCYNYISVKYSHFDCGFARAFTLDKTNKKYCKQNMFCQKISRKIYLFKQSLVCAVFILLINSNKRINDHKNGFDLLRRTYTSDVLSLNILNALQLIEKTMIQVQLSNYALSSIRSLK